MNDLQNMMKRLYPEQYISIIEYNNHLYLDGLVVNKNQQCKGIGTKIMKDICSYADDNDKYIVLLPALDYGATSIERLKAFYNKFGFVDNKLLRDKRCRIKEMIGV